MKFFIIVLICLITLACFAQEPVKQSIPITLMLTDAELKAILHYNKTVEEFTQQVIEDRVREYMKYLANEYRNEDLEIIVNLIDIKTWVEIEAEKKDKDK